MRSFLLAIFIIFALKAAAQTCTGSLGDPVINQDFGSGANPGPPLANSITNLTYTSNNCPDDGYYTISNSLVAPGNCHLGTWHSLTSDHTGNPNGYMMIVNASFAPSIFFTQTANGLCPNTTYEFSSYILNLITYAAYSQGDFIEPNITFSIETSAGVVLATSSTGIIPSTTSPTWVQYGTYFTTPADVTGVVVKMTNNAPGGNGNDLVLDDITFRACGPVIQSGFTSPTGPAVQQLCQGSNASYVLKASVVGNSSPYYQWQSNADGTGWTDLPGKTADFLDVNFVNASTGVYQYRVGVANGSNVTSVDCRVYSPPLSITVNALPVVPPVADQTICEGYLLQLTASGGSTYLWSGPNLAPTAQNPLIINNITPGSAGIYTVQVTSSEGCSAPPVHTLVKVVPKVVAAVSAPATICAGETVQLSASGGLYYQWTPSAGLDRDDVPNPVAKPLVTTTYNVNVSNDGCNDDTKSVTVTVTQNPVANAGINKQIFEGQSVKLDGTIQGDEISKFYWSPATGLSDPLLLNPIASPTDNITYTLTVISQNCGTSVSNVFVRVYKKVIIPNTFTPNNDGINDYWNIDALVTYPESLIRVFDRYGQQVFQSTGYSRPWDGKYNGLPLPQGTYYYIIDLKDNTPLLAGWVLLLR